MNKAWFWSPRQVDLLSWFTGPLVPIVFGGLAVSFGAGVSVVLVEGTSRWLLVGLSLAAMALAFGVLAFHASPRRRNRVAGITVLPISLGWASYLLAVVSEWGTTTPFELRWSPIALALLIASLAPFVPAIRILVLGVLSCIVTMAGTASSLLVHPHPTYWPTTVQLLIGSTMIVVASAAGTVFSYHVVARTMRWASSATGDELSSGVLGEAVRRRILHEELASVSDRAVPLLEKVVKAGVVTSADREEATKLAERLRAELVERSQRSWLESLTRQLNLTVIDHDRRAERMNPAQRSALLGLLTAATSEVTEPAHRTLIELRGEADGSTAVAITADHSLPDGHRLTFLAPYYVNLAAAVDDVEWGTGDNLRLNFRIPAGPAARTETPPQPRRSAPPEDSEASDE